MRLEFNKETGAFVLRVSRKTDTPLVHKLMREHGWDISGTRSTFETAVMFTKDHYAAAAFSHLATPEAAEAIAWIVAEVDASWRTESKAHIKVPYGCELWPFQKAGVEYALKRTHTLIGDQPGLGKTNQAIAIANEMNAQRVLVICPANIRLQWIKRIREWTTLPWPYVLHPILKAGHGVHPRAHWTVVSYDLAGTPQIGAALAEHHYDLLVLDEAHMLKTTDSRRTRAIFGGGKVERPFTPLAERAASVVALTGTPLPNRPREAYTLARALDWGSVDFASEDAFCNRYNPSATFKNSRGVVIGKDERSGRHHELQHRLRAHFMVRREKHGERGVMKQLQLPLYDIVQVETTGPVKLALEAESLLKIDPDNLSETIKVDGHISVVRKQMGVAMAPQVADYADMLLDGGEEKLVIFAWHLEVLDILQHKLEKWGVLRIDGSTSARQREIKVSEFQRDARKHVIIGNMLAMGVGTDGLQHVCNHCLVAEPDWVPGNNVQAIDRLDRGGQARQVQAELFVAPGSISEKVLGSALRKARVTHSALDERLA